jgi:hypothetical protein
MKAHARWVAGLVAGLGLANSALADPDRYDTRQPDGSRKTVIEVLPATDLQGSLDRLPMAGDAPAKPPVRVIDVGAPANAAPRVVDVGPQPQAQPVPLNMWAEVDLLEWWYRGSSIPPLVTAGSPLDTIPGAIGQSGTRILYGGSRTDPEGTPGGRGRLGGWLTGTPFGWEIGGFYTQPQEQIGAFNSNDFAVLARPFYDAFVGTPASLLFGAAGAFQGTITTHTRTTFWGAEAIATAAMDTEGALAGFVGYRYLQMSDDLSVIGQYTLGPGGLAFANGISLLPGATGLVGDRVFTRNEFSGGQLGLKYHACYGRFGFDLRGSLAVGVGSERVTLQGETNTVDAGGTIRSGPGGLLIEPSNGGVYGRDLLTVVPEVGARLSYMIVPGVSLHAGYDFLYWASVARAGDQLDHAVDTRQMPSSAGFTGGPGFRPISPLRDTAFWAQGFNVGVRVDY